jgi:hypothetical protein
VNDGVVKKEKRRRITNPPLLRKRKKSAGLQILCCSLKKIGIVYILQTLRNESLDKLCQIPLL